MALGLRAGVPEVEICDTVVVTLSSGNRGRAPGIDAESIGKGPASSAQLIAAADTARCPKSRLAACQWRPA